MNELPILGIAIHMCYYRDWIEGKKPEKLKQVMSDIDEWVSFHGVGIPEKRICFYDVTVIFKEPSDYALFVLTWKGNTYRLIQ